MGRPRSRSTSSGRQAAAPASAPGFSRQRAAARAVHAAAAAKSAAGDASGTALDEAGRWGGRPASGALPAPCGRRGCRRSHGPPGQGWSGGRCGRGKSRKSTARCSADRWPITVPVAVFSAANRSTVPCRAQSKCAARAPRGSSAPPGRCAPGPGPAVSHPLISHNPQQTPPTGQQLDRRWRSPAQSPPGRRLGSGNPSGARAWRGEAGQAAAAHLWELLPAVLASQDAAEGLHSFVERRAGRFTGR